MDKLTTSCWDLPHHATGTHHVRVPGRQVPIACDDLCTGFHLLQWGGCPILFRLRPIPRRTCTWVPVRPTSLLLCTRCDEVTGPVRNHPWPCILCWSVSSPSFSVSLLHWQSPFFLDKILLTARAVCCSVLRRSSFCQLSGPTTATATRPSLPHHVLEWLPHYLSCLLSATGPGSCLTFWISPAWGTQPSPSETVHECLGNGISQVGCAKAVWRKTPCCLLAFLFVRLFYRQEWSPFLFLVAVHHIHSFLFSRESGEGKHPLRKALLLSTLQLKDKVKVARALSLSLSWHLLVQLVIPPSVPTAPVATVLRPHPWWSAVGSSIIRPPEKHHFFVLCPWRTSTLKPRTPSLIHV